MYFLTQDINGKKLLAIRCSQIFPEGKWPVNFRFYLHKVFKQLCKKKNLVPVKSVNNPVGSDVDGLGEEIFDIKLLTSIENGIWKDDIFAIEVKDLEYSNELSN